MSISIDTKQALHRIQHCFKTILKKLGREANFLSMIKMVLCTPKTNMIFNDRKIEGFPLKSGMR